MSLSALPGIIATIKEDIEFTEQQLTYWMDKRDALEDEHQAKMDEVEKEMAAIRHRLRDMQCTVTTLEQYEGGEWVRQA